MCRISRFHSRWMKQQQEKQKEIFEQLKLHEEPHPARIRYRNDRSTGSTNIKKKS